MKNTGTHHEILFFTGTSLANRQLNERSENNGRKNSAVEDLEKACWNGILHELFPEILGRLYPKCESFLWQVMSGKNFLYINIGPHPAMAEHRSSIDPYLFSIDYCEN